MNGGGLALWAVHEMRVVGLVTSDEVFVIFAFNEASNWVGLFLNPSKCGEWARGWTSIGQSAHEDFPAFSLEARSGFAD